MTFCRTTELLSDRQLERKFFLIVSAVDHTTKIEIASLCGSEQNAAVCLKQNMLTLDLGASLA